MGDKMKNWLANRAGNAGSNNRNATTTTKAWFDDVIGGIRDNIPSKPFTTQRPKNMNTEPSKVKEWFGDVIGGIRDNIPSKPFRPPPTSSQSGNANDESGTGAKAKEWLGGVVSNIRENISKINVADGNQNNAGPSEPGAGAKAKEWLGGVVTNIRDNIASKSNLTDLNKIEPGKAAKAKEWIGNVIDKVQSTNVSMPDVNLRVKAKEWLDNIRDKNNIDATNSAAVVDTAKADDNGNDATGGGDEECKSEQKVEVDQIKAITSEENMDNSSPKSIFSYFEEPVVGIDEADNKDHHDEPIEEQDPTVDTFDDTDDTIVQADDTIVQDDDTDVDHQNDTTDVDQDDDSDVEQARTDIDVPSCSKNVDYYSYENGLPLKRPFSQNLCPPSCSRKEAKMLKIKQKEQAVIEGRQHLIDLKKKLLTHKVAVIGAPNVGKSCLVNRFFDDTYESNGVDDEMQDLPVRNQYHCDEYDISDYVLPLSHKKELKCKVKIFDVPGCMTVEKKLNKNDDGDEIEKQRRQADFSYDFEIIVKQAEAILLCFSVGEQNQSSLKKTIDIYKQICRIKLQSKKIPTDPETGNLSPELTDVCVALVGLKTDLPTEMVVKKIDKKILFIKRYISQEEAMKTAEYLNNSSYLECSAKKDDNVKQLFETVLCQLYRHKKRTIKQIDQTVKIHICTHKSTVKLSDPALERRNDINRRKKAARVIKKHARDIGKTVEGNVVQLKQQLYDSIKYPLLRVYGHIHPEPYVDPYRQPIEEVKEDSKKSKKSKESKKSTKKD